jgi:hypothetical protein
MSLYLGELRTFLTPRPFSSRAKEKAMRRNSGKDESRDRLLDPTLKEHERERGKSGTAVLDPGANEGEISDNLGQRTTGMGSHARKTGEKGEA